MDCDDDLKIDCADEEDLACELQQLESELKAKPAMSKADQFKALIGAQSSQGFWPTTSLALISQLMPSKKLPTSPTELQLTVIAMCLLEEVFGDKEQEWQMIYQKAKQWLLSEGQDPVKLVDEMLNTLF